MTKYTQDTLMYGNVHMQISIVHTISTEH